MADRIAEILKAGQVMQNRDPRWKKYKWGVEAFILKEAPGVNPSFMSRELAKLINPIVHELGFRYSHNIYKESDRLVITLFAGPTINGKKIRQKFKKALGDLRKKGIIEDFYVDTFTKEWAWFKKARLPKKKSRSASRKSRS